MKQIAITFVLAMTAIACGPKAEEGGDLKANDPPATKADADKAAQERVKNNPNASVISGGGTPISGKD